MKWIRIGLGVILIILGIAYALLALLAGISPGWGMSGGYVSQFAGALVLAFGIIGIGITFAFYRQKEK